MYFGNKLHSSNLCPSQFCIPAISKTKSRCKPTQNLWRIKSTKNLIIFRILFYVKPFFVFILFLLPLLHLLRQIAFQTFKASSFKSYSIICPSISLQTTFATFHTRLKTQWKFLEIYLCLPICFTVVLITIYVLQLF